MATTTTTTTTSSSRLQVNESKAALPSYVLEDVEVKKTISH
jgi:hypothetical protein